MSNSRPKALTITRIVGTPALKAVYNAYELARPDGLVTSYMLPQEKEEPPSSSGGILTKAYGNVKAGLVGGILGFKGVVGYAAIEVADGYFTALNEWYRGESTDDLKLVDFCYLQPLYNQLENNNNANVSEQDRKRLQALYDLFYQYQLQKMSRGWYSTGFGRNYRDDVIDDPKYLTAIFIGRKLVAAANATSTQDYQNQMHHLDNFINALSRDAQLFYTRSNDSSYLSLISVIELLQKEQFNAKSRELRGELLNQMRVIVEVLPGKCDEVLRQIKEQLLLTVTSIKETELRQLGVGDFGIYQKTSISSSPDFQKIKNIFLDDKGTISTEDIAHLLEKASGTSVDKDSPSVQAINTLLEKRRALLAWNNILHQIKGFMDQLGVLGLSLELDNLRIVFEKVQHAYVEMFKARQDFVTAFGELESKSIIFKQARLNIYRPLNDDSLRQDMSYAINILAGISTEQAQSAINEKAKYDMAVINQAINNLQTAPDPAPYMIDVQDQSLPPSVYKAKKVFETLESIDNEIEERRIEQVGRLEQQVVSLATELGDIMLERDRLKEEVEALKKQNPKLEELQVQPIALATSSSSIQDNIDTVSCIDNVLTPIDSDSEKQVAFSQSIRGLMKTFDLFIDRYKEHNQSSGFSLFKNHGRDGRIRADKIKAIWFNKSQDFLDKLDSMTSTTEQCFGDAYLSVSKGIKGMISSLMTEPVLIEGNFHKHSLKTFIMSYYDGVCELFQPSLGESPDNLTIVPEDFFKSAYTDKVLVDDFSASKQKEHWEQIVCAAQDSSAGMSHGFMSPQ